MTDEQQTRGYRSRQDRRAELLDAAALVVRDDGLRGLTTRAVAARAGVAHGVVHYAFGARRNLVVALLERQARAVLPPVLAAADEHDDLATALEAGISAYLDLVRREPERFRVLEALSATALAPDGDGDLLDAERRLWRDGVVAGIERWTARHGAAPSEPVPVVADAVITLVDGLARAAWSDPDGTATARSRALLVRGLTTAVTAVETAAGTAEH
ncbi:TetR family transcriptional regulator [Curtobacterium flaccumfaciens]|uniref:TetR family transcriptional regulator n=1 Tax=Curtobacterium flaccumfaciens TaxID=2035 RepID=UPI0026583FED|nr:TetR family transcriptional regulator [Curtobacterium flaccumfaciens]MCS5517852.1 TetR family transcriptional regulator [Curtobacterium flaccumfaciens]